MPHTTQLRHLDRNEEFSPAYPQPLSTAENGVIFALARASGGVKRTCRTRHNSVISTAMKNSHPLIPSLSTAENGVIFALARASGGVKRTCRTRHNSVISTAMKNSHPLIPSLSTAENGVIFALARASGGVKCTSRTRRRPSLEDQAEGAQLYAVDLIASSISVPLNTPDTSRSDPPSNRSSPSPRQALARRRRSTPSP